MADGDSELFLLTLEPVFHFYGANVKVHFDAHFHSIDLFIKYDSERVYSLDLLNRILVPLLALLIFFKLFAVVFIPLFDVLGQLDELLIEEQILFFLALIHLHHLCLPLLKLLDGEHVKDLISLLYVGSRHLLEPVLFDLACDFLHEVLSLDMHQVLYGDPLGVALGHPDHPVRSSLALEAQLLIELHLLEILSHHAEVRHFQEHCFRPPQSY